AADAFKETRMESLQSFAEIYGIKELQEREPESDTRVHIATVQAMAGHRQGKNACRVRPRSRSNRPPPLG
ncbi:MAG: hypothetical protein ACK5IA_17340, partial [Cyanobacteriota bacterium]